MCTKQAWGLKQPWKLIINPAKNICTYIKFIITKKMINIKNDPV